MKAIAVRPATRRLERVDVPEPALRRPSDVKVRILEVGVCGTDREICAFEYGTPPPGEDRLVIGHESLGEVIEVGPAAAGVRPGDLVVTMVRRPCPHATCRACVAGRQDFCFTGDFRERGIKEAHGFMTELIVDDARYLNVVPAALRDVAVLVEPLTIAEKALEQLWDVQERLPWVAACHRGTTDGAGLRCLVLGAGPVGLLGAMAFRAAGFDTTVYSRETPPNPKSLLVEAIGGHYRDASAGLPEIAAAIGNVDVVYEATGASALSFEAMKILGTNGVFIFTGVPGRKAPVEVDTDLIMRNLVLGNQVVLGTVNAGRQTFEAAIRDMGVFHERWPEALRALVTGRFPIEAYADLLLGQAHGIKNVLAIG